MSDENQEQDERPQPAEPTVPAGLIEKVARFYQKAMPSAQKARSWLQRHRLDDPELISHFQFGYANGRLITTLPKEGEGLKTALRSIGLMTVAGQEYFLRHITLPMTLKTERFGKLHVDTLDFYSAKSRKTLLQDLCCFFEEAPDIIDGDLVKLIRLCEDYSPQERTANTPPLIAMTEEERQEAIALGKAEDICAAILRDFDACGLVGEESNKLLCYLAAISRKTDEPISVLILSSSGAGKSTLQDATLLLCPPEDVVKLTSLTGKALFYKGTNSLKHKILALEEEAGVSQASYAIRNLISAGELVIETTVKDLGSGRLTTMQNRVEGPTSVFITTTNPDVDPETRSRFFVTGVDESREQTRAILESQRKRRTWEGRGSGAERETAIRKHRNFQRLLKPLAVVNPFAERLAYSDDRLQSRRDQPKYLNLINAVAFLRQMSKTVQSRNGRDYVEVEEDDLRIATNLADEILGKSLDDLMRDPHAPKGCQSTGDSTYAGACNPEKPETISHGFDQGSQAGAREKSGGAMKTLADYHGEYMDHLRSLNFSPYTIRQSRYCAGVFIRWLEERQRVREPDRLRARHLQAWQKEISQKTNPTGRPLKPRSINKYVETVTGLLKHLAQTGVVSQQMSSVLQYVKEPFLLPGSVLTHDTMTRLLRVVSTETPDGYRLRTMLEVLYSSGIRVAELLGLDLGAVDFKNATAKVLGKGRKERVVPIGKTALQYLESYVRAIRSTAVKDDAPALFVDSTGRRFPYYTFRRQVKACARRAGISVEVTPHTFRRSCATELLRGGANMYHVKELLGHESLETLKHYAKLTITDLKVTHEKCHPREREERAGQGD